MFHKKKKNYESRKTSCIQATIAAMKTISTGIYIGGKNSEDGLYLAGKDENGEWIYFTHFTDQDIARLEAARKSKRLKEYLKKSK